MHILKTTLLTILIVFSACIINAQCVSGNCVDGNGTFKWENGDMYVGDWSGGNRTGYGRYDWVDGSYYVGTFKDNLLNGQGSYYAADGTSMIGNFEKNNFIPPADDTDLSTDDQKVGEESLTELLSQWDAQSREDSLAKDEALKNASKEDFCTVVEKLVKEFPNGYAMYRGPAQVGVMSFGETWYSLLMIKNSLEAGITSGFSSSGSFYNILYEGQNFDDSKSRYDDYVNQMMECKTGCCTMVYDPYEYKSDSYTSYSNSWLTFLVNDGYDTEIYTDMVIEIELMSQIIDNGWQIVFRMYHLSDMD